MAKDLKFYMNKNYRVSLYFEPEGYWVAEHPELTGCIADGETAQEALSSLDVSRELWIESRLATGLEIPEPQEEPQFSGKFVLRIAKSMHSKLAKEADAEGISLNTYIGNVLASRNAQQKQTYVSKEDFREVVSSVLSSNLYSRLESPDSMLAFSNVASIPANNLTSMRPQTIVQLGSVGLPWENMNPLAQANSSGMHAPDIPTQEIRFAQGNQSRYRN
jgi:antitoxin HicB